MKTNKVYFLPAWGNTPSQLLEAMKLQTPDNSGIWKHIEGTDNIFETDFFIMQDYTYPEMESFLDINNLWEKTYYFGREVPGGGPIKRYPQVKSFSYLDKNSYLFTKWVYPSQINGGVSTSYNELGSFKPPKKNKSMICVQSTKTILEGHKLRLRFIEKFSEKYPQEIDLAGSIAKSPKFIKFNNCIEMVDDDKFETCKDYKYCLSFDNGQYENYFGTQFTDALLSWCIPIYWGAPNIDNFFPEGSYISFDIKNENEIDRIINIINDPEDYDRRLPALKEARNLVLNKYNIWDTINEVITTGKSTW